MTQGFCDHHICILLAAQERSEKPLDVELSIYFKNHKSLGANDRRVIGHTLYQMVRSKSLIDYLRPNASCLEKLRCFRDPQFELFKKDLSIPEPVRLGMPSFLYERLFSTYGEEKGRSLCRILNQEAPTTIRVNTLKIERDLFREKLKDKLLFTPCPLSNVGLQLSKREPLFSLPEFREGLFEVQDEGSQLIAQLIQAKPKDHVLDFCSGSGGKTLAFAPALQGKGQIYLHDNRPHILLQARKRLQRAGVQNVQFCLPKKPVDWVLTDVPCSGTGTLRRNPDAKWRIDSAMIDRLLIQQRQIVEEALSFLKPNGKLVYATCSILPEENERQVEFFLKHHSLSLEGPFLSLLPEENGHDGFFAAVLKKETMLSSSTL